MCPRFVTEEKVNKREEELIAITRELIDRDGIAALTIDKLVAASPYSKGTIYNHFQGKEDLLTAVCVVSMGEMIEIFRSALRFEGRSRERSVVLMLSYLIWAQLHPQQLFVVLMAHSPAVVQCSSQHRLAQQEEREKTLMSMVGTLAEDGVRDGDFSIPDGMNMDQVTFAMWSTGFGSLALVMTKGECAGRKDLQLEREYFTNTRLMLDGLNWRPLFDEWDYDATLKRATETIFKQEIATLEKLGRGLRIPFSQPNLTA